MLSSVLTNLTKHGASVLVVVTVVLAAGMHHAKAESGLDAALLARALDRAANLPRLHALIVALDGKIEIERAFRGPGLDAQVNVKSVAKSLISALVGIAIARGELAGADQPIAPLLSEHLPAQTDARLNQITIDHLLSMRAGLERTSGRNYGSWVASQDWVRHALSRPFADEPAADACSTPPATHTCCRPSSPTPPGAAPTNWRARVARLVARHQYSTVGTRSPGYLFRW